MKPILLNHFLVKSKNQVVKAMDTERGEKKTNEFLTVGLLYTLQYRDLVAINLSTQQPCPWPDTDVVFINPS